ncbi:hypothetical protein ABVK25_002455 [Lepraria finkii]|uniref:Uncharacterized protein n=1 Tax=Lepraria finkii TaxID=1340010 RepID=A0ABR4BHW3_9LECA
MPPARYLHGGAASEHPLPNTNASNKASYGEQIQSTVGKLPTLIGKGLSPQEPHGTLIICGGLSSLSSSLNDTWVFNIILRTPWQTSLALIHNRL